MTQRGFWQRGQGAELLERAQERVRAGDDQEVVLAEIAKAASDLLKHPVTPKNVRDALYRVEHPDYRGAAPGGRRRGRGDSSALPPSLLRAIDAAADILDVSIKERMAELEGEISVRRDTRVSQSGRDDFRAAARGDEKAGVCLVSVRRSPFPFVRVATRDGRGFSPVGHPRIGEQGTANGEPNIYPLPLGEG